MNPLQIVSANALFGRMDRRARAEIADALEFVALAKGEILFRQDDPGDSLYILHRGGLEVQVRGPDGAPRVLDRLEPGATVGEMALLTGQPRTADVVALEDSQLVRLSREGFEHLAQRHPAIVDGLAWSITPRLQRSQLAGILYRLLGDLDTGTLQSLMDKLHWRRLTDGEVLIRQGETATSMYIVVNGRLQVVREEPHMGGGQRVLDEVGSGVTIGEAALLMDDVRSATVYAIRETDVVEMTRETFEDLVRDHPQVMQEIARLLLTRLQRTQRIAVSQGRRALTVALVPAGCTAPALMESAEQLYKVLSAIGETALFTADRLDDAYGRPGAAQLDGDHPLSLVVNGWLQQQEERFEHIIFVADSELGVWTRRCISQADRVLILADAGGDPRPGPLEAGLNPLTRRELVLLYDTVIAEPSGTTRWLDPRSVTAHHHIRIAELGDWQRLARRLTNRAVGVVLSGGSARGLAHIGVVRAMEEAGLAVDYIGGTSMGAMIGAGWATGLNPEDGIRLANRMANPATIMDRTFPYTSVMASGKVTAVLRELYGERHIEDLWRPFFCLSTNLTKAEPVVHERGLLWRAVRASAALPGVFSPILSDDHDLLVDGGVMNNFPVDVMAGRLDCGLLIGVNVSPHLQQDDNYSFGESISGWEVLFNRANPFAEGPRVPSLAAIMLRTMEVNSLYQRNTAEQLADIVIEPDVRDIGAMDFSAYETLIARGYEAGRAELARWQSTLVAV
jgi:predicted acylesterase/phospholipase RssA/CRP-like cAMP-binding protein